MAERKRIEAEEPEQHTDSLHTKYRPRRLKDVWGQDDVTRSLEATLRAKARPHTFLFTGPAGTGKTTLARILAAELGVPESGVVEHDAASKSGIDDMRGITEALRYNGFGESPNKAIILNECQGLSKAAWDSLLTATEEPPPHVYFFFTSTDPGKIPKAMVTRAVTHALRAIPIDDLLDLLDFVIEEECLPTPKKILGMVAQAAEGSARAALTLLAKVQAVEDQDEAASLLATPLENSEVIDLCRLMMSGKLSWKRLVEVVKGLEVPAETARIIITAYMTTVALGARNDKEAMQAVDILRHFSTPYSASDKMAPLLLSFDRYVFG